MSQILRQSTSVVVRLGVAVAVADGFTPVTTLALTTADEAELLKAAGAATVSLASNAFTAITGADGWYDLTLTTTDTNTLGTLDVAVNDDSLILPIHARFQVIEEAAFDAIYAASASPATTTGAVGSVTGAVGSVTGAVGSVASNGITAASIATGAVDADALAADAVAEIADGVWDEDATAHQTLGTFGQAIGDPVADTNTIYKAVVTDAAGATVGVDVVAVLADTDDIQTRLPAVLVAGRIDASVGAMAADVVTAAAIANGAIDAATFATDAIASNVIAAAAANKLADHTWRRTYANARASTDGDAVAFRSPLGAVGKLVNKWSISGSTLTIFQEDDLTSTAPGGTQTVTGTAGADPITTLDTV